MKPIFAKRARSSKSSIGDKVVAGLEAKHTGEFVKADAKSASHVQPKRAPVPVKGKMSVAAKMPSESKANYCPTCGKKMSGSDSESAHEAKEKRVEKKTPIPAKRAPTKRK